MDGGMAFLEPLVVSCKSSVGSLAASNASDAGGLVSAPLMKSSAAALVGKRLYTALYNR